MAATLEGQPWKGSGDVVFGIVVGGGGGEAPRILLNGWAQRSRSAAPSLSLSLRLRLSLPVEVGASGSELWPFPREPGMCRLFRGAVSR